MRKSAFLLVAVLILSVFAGCGSGKPTLEDFEGYWRFEPTENSVYLLVIEGTSWEEFSYSGPPNLGGKVTDNKDGTLLMEETTLGEYGTATLSEDKDVLVITTPEESTYEYERSTEEELDKVLAGEYSGDEEPVEEEPVEDETGSGGIATESYYYWDGNPDSGSAYFYPDGVCEIKNSGSSDTLSGTWTADGDAVSITLDDGSGEQTIDFSILDGGETIVTPDGERLLLDGTGGVDPDDASGDDSGVPDVGSAPMIITNDDVYYHHDSSDTTIRFNTDGTVQYNGGGEIIIYDYEINGDTVYVTEGGEDVTELLIIDPCTLQDEDGSIFAMPESEGQELVVASSYSMNADFSAGLFFSSDGTVEFTDQTGTLHTGTYETDASTVTLDLEGNITELEIVNSRILKASDDLIFVRLY